MSVAHLSRLCCPRGDPVANGGDVGSLVPILPGSKERLVGLAGRAQRLVEDEPLEATDVNECGYQNYLSNFSGKGGILEVNKR